MLVTLWLWLHNDLTLIAHTALSFQFCPELYQHHTAICKTVLVLTEAVREVLSDLAFGSRRTSTNACLTSVLVLQIFAARDWMGSVVIERIPWKGSNVPFWQPLFAEYCRRISHDCVSQIWPRLFTHFAIFLYFHKNLQCINAVCDFMLSGFFQPSQMGGIPVMTQPTLIYSQPVMRPPNPFGPVPGAQVCILKLLVLGMNCT